MKYFISFLFIGIVHFSFAQQWKKLANDLNVNLYDVVEEAEIYFKNIDKTKKGSGWKSYQRWLYENEPKYYPSGKRNTINPYFVAKEYKNFIENNTVANQTPFNNGWEELGPYYIEEVTGHYSVGLGRVESFYIDSDPNIMYLGSRSGGFWKTSDGGNTWSNTTDNLIASGVNTIAVNPNNTNQILINVRNSYNGTTHGVYASSDAGETWTLTNFNPENLNWGGLGTNDIINTIKYHPTIPDLIFITTSKGLYRSSDNLISWNQVAQPNSTYEQIEFHPTDSSIIYVTKWYEYSRILVSNDAGRTFTNSEPIPNNNYGFRISVSEDCENCVFAASSDGIWKSTDEGFSFNLVSGTYIDEISNYGAFAVSDVNEDIMLYGDIDTHMSYDGGANFQKTTFWSQGNANYDQTGTYVHADIRGAVAIDGVFWVNTDGMLCKSEDNGVTWEILEGQSIRENYCLGASQSNHFRSIAGSQDNGTSIKNENNWIEFYGADGMEGIIHPLNDDWMIGSLQFGGKRRTKDGGYQQQGVNPSDFEGDWVTPLLYDPNNQMTVFTMSNRIFKSEDFGSNWTTLGAPFSPGQNIQNAAISENNSNTIAVSYYNNLKISNDGGSTFNLVSQSLPNQFITDIAFDPNNDQTIIVTYGTYGNNNSKVFMSNDQGQSWENITYNLGNMPIRSVVIDHTENSTLYLGAEIGIYKKAMTATSWELFSDDLPNTTAMELEVIYGSNTLRAATWGRGLWESSLSGRENYPSILTTNITKQPTDTQPKEGIDQFVTSTIEYDGTLANVNVAWSSDDNSGSIPMNNSTADIWVSETAIPNFSEGSKVFFKVFATSENGLTTETYKFMYTVKENVYCIPSMNCSYGDGLQWVQLVDINNTSGCEGYANFTEQATNLEQGTDYEITITTGYGDQYIKAWIDYNNDLEFTEDEVIVNNYVIEPGLDSAGEFTEAIGISIPEDAALGQHVLRIKTNWNAPVPEDSCVETQYGETEDYTVIIEEQSLGVINSNFSIQPSLYPNPTDGTVTVDLKKYYSKVSTALHDMLGRKIMTKHYDQIQNFELTLQQSPGVYFLTVISENKKVVFKLIKN